MLGRSPLLKKKKCLQGKTGGGVNWSLLFRGLTFLFSLDPEGAEAQSFRPFPPPFFVVPIRRRRCGAWRRWGASWRSGSATSSSIAAWPSGPDHCFVDFCRFTETQPMSWPFRKFASHFVVLTLCCIKLCIFFLGKCPPRHFPCCQKFSLLFLLLPSWLE